MLSMDLRRREGVSFTFRPRGNIDVARDGLPPSAEVENYLGCT
jgi:hypothetical protein